MEPQGYRTQSHLWVRKRFFLFSFPNTFLIKAAVLVRLGPPPPSNRDLQPGRLRPLRPRGLPPRPPQQPHRRSQEPGALLGGRGGQGDGGEATCHAKAGYKSSSTSHTKFRTKNKLCFLRMHEPPRRRRQPSHHRFPRREEPSLRTCAHRQQRLLDRLEQVQNAFKLSLKMMHLPRFFHSDLACTEPTGWAASASDPCGTYCRGWGGHSGWLQCPTSVLKVGTII